MVLKTHLTPRNYTEKEVCRIVNQKQVALYLKNKVYPIDIYCSYDLDGKPVVVHIFLKEETKELYQAWLAHELD